MPNIDSLNINIKAEASQAIKSLETLADALKHVQSGLDSLSPTKLTNLSNKSAGIENTATALEHFSTSLQGFKSVDGLSDNFNILANSIKSFGYKGMTNAIGNMQKITTELRNMLDVIARSKKINTNTLKALEQIANVLNASRGVPRTSTSSVNDLQKGLKELGKVSLTKIGNSFSNFGNKLKQLTPFASKARLSLTELASAFGILYASLFWVQRIVTALTSVMGSFSDYIESFNFWDVAITNSVNQDSTNQWSDAGYTSGQAYAEGLEQGLADLNEKMTGFVVDIENGTGDIAVSMKSNLGLSITALTQFEAKIEAVTSSLGIASDTANQMTMGLTMLSGDISSLYNVDLDTAMTALNSGLIGQSRALYKYGIDITNATLQTYAYANGITKSVSSMTQSEKMQLRYLAVLDQAKVSYADLSNTINNYANQVRVLQNGIKNLSATIGRIFVPIITTVLPYVNALVKLLQECALWVAKLTGIDFSGDSAISALDTGIEDLDDSLDDATDSAKSLKQQLLGIDEINNITSTSSSSSSGSGSGSTIDLSDAIGIATSDYEKQWEEAYSKVQDKASGMVAKIKAVFKKDGFQGVGKLLGTSIANGLRRIHWADIQSSAKKIGTSIAEFINGAVSPESFGAIGTTIAEALNTILDFKNGFLSTIDPSNVGTSIATGVIDFLNKYDFKTAGENFDLMVHNLFDAINSAVSTFIQDDGIEKTFSALKDFTAEFDLLDWTIVLGIPALKLAGGVFANSVFQNLILSKLLGKISGLGLAGTASAIGSVAIPVVATVAITLGTVFIAHKLQEFCETNETYLNFKKSIQDSIDEDEKNKELKYQHISETVQNFKNDVSETYNSITEGISTSWETFKTDWGGLGDYLYQNVWGPVKDKFLTPMKNGWDKMWGSLGNIVTTFKNDFKSLPTYLSDIFSSGITKMKEIWNNFATWLNEKLTINIDTGTLIGKGISDLLGTTQIHLANLPTFATGGFPEDGIFMANSNELVGSFSNGKTAVANNEQIVSGISYGVQSAVERVLVPYLAQLVDSNNEIANKDVEVSSNGIFRSVRKSARVYQKSTGKNAFSF